MITANWGIEVHGIIEVPTLHSCSLIHKSVFKTAGLYDYNYYKGSAFREETDFYYRVKRAGFKLFFQSTAITYHYPQSSGGCFLSPFRNRFFEMRNHLLFIGKFYGFKTLFMVPSFLLYSSARAIQFFKGSSVHRNS